LGLDLVKGCVHRCGFCTARAYANAPGDEVVFLYTGTTEILETELAAQASSLRAVLLCPSTDPFPPLAEVQAETCRLIPVLARHGVQAWLMTRGYIRPAALKIVAAYQKHLKITIPLITMDRALQRTLEPLTAPPRMRLRQIRRLRELGIAVQVALDPLLPGLTDTRENLTSLLDALERIGVTSVTAGYLFLRPRMQENLVAALRPFGFDDQVIDAYAGGPILEAGEITPARFLPKSRRQRGYAALMALAADRGITIRISALSNPDFRPGHSGGVGARPRQRLLPPFESSIGEVAPALKTYG
jgi:pyruvate-formate lyase-activating enzyme